MENYIEYLNYAIKYSYEEFFEKGFKNSGLLENWLTYNLFHLYNFGDANRFAPKYIKYLKENLAITRICYDKLNQLNQRCNANDSNIAETQIGLTETHQKALDTDATVTDIQLALVELYEMILGGK